MTKMHFMGALTFAALVFAANPVHAQDMDSPSAFGRHSHSGRQDVVSPLAALRTPDLAEIEQGEILEIGHKGSAVEVIRSLMLELDYPVEAAGDLYDRELAYQIGRFQQQHKLADPDSEHFGKVGPATLQGLKQQAARGRYNVELGRQLASYARSRISGGTGYCYHYVARAIHAYLPQFLKGMHAYLAAPQLASSGFFKEIDVPSASLPALPAGAVVVWAKGNSPSGHISIADGKGNEISDHVQPQMTRHHGGANHRVFLPLGKS